MRLKRFTNYLLEHRWQMLVLTVAIAFVPILSVFAILIAALITLRKGALEGAIYTAAASSSFMVKFFSSGIYQDTSNIFIWAALSVAVFSNVLTYVFAIMLRRQTSWSVILQIAALLGVLIVSILHLVFPDIANWWAVQLQTYYAQAPVVTDMLKKSALKADKQIEMINITKQYATGLMTAAILFNAILQLVIARWWETYVFNYGKLRLELHNIQLSQLAAVLFVASLALSYLGNRVVLDIMPILYLLFGMAGLSLIHYLFGLMRSSTVWFWLALLYMTLIFALPTSVILLAVLALIDAWLDVRKRYRKI